MLRIVKYPVAPEADSLGRNGYIRTSGVEIMTGIGQEIHLTPLTSKGTPGRCRLVIDGSALDEIIAQLRSAAAYNRLKSLDRIELLDICTFDEGLLAETRRYFYDRCSDAARAVLRAVPDTKEAAE